MPDPVKPPMPPQPVTTAFAAPDAQAIVMQEILSGIKDMKENQRVMMVNQDMQGSAISAVQADLQGLHEWKGYIVQWKDDVDTQRKNNSVRARTASLHDGEQDQKLSTIDRAVLDIQAMTQQQNKLFGIDPKSVVEWFRSPNFKRDVATVFVAAATGYTAFKELVHR